MAEPWSPIGIEVTSLLLKKRYNFVDALCRDRLLFEDALECILETLRGESVEDDIDSLGESLEVTAMEVRRNPIEIRVCSENYQVAGIRPPTAMEFHREQQLSFRNPRRHRTSRPEVRSDGMLHQIPVRPFGTRLSTAQSVDHRVEPNRIVDDLLEPNRTALVAVVSFDIGGLRVGSRCEEFGIVLQRLSRYDHVEIRRETLIKRRDSQPPTRTYGNSAPMTAASVSSNSSSRSPKLMSASEGRCGRCRSPDAHFDEGMAAVVGRYGAAAVQTVIHRVLVEQYPFRTATVGLDMRDFDGVRIGTTADWFLHELNADPDT